MPATRRLLLAALALTAAAAAWSSAATAASTTASTPKTAWLCKPGIVPDPCTPGLDTTRFSPAGARLGVDRIATPKRPAIDCFYVYPTVSGQPTPQATLRIDPEERSIALFQAARYSQLCRVFAPMYRQRTLAGLFGGKGLPPTKASAAYADVRDAWRTYLATENHGRGVVLIGHSQGSFELRQLIASEIDPKPAVRRRLVSALLLGGNVEVRAGSDVGGDFQHVRACRARTQVGCVVAFSTFEDTPPAASLFGRTRPPGRRVLCTNPAALAGGSGTLDPIFPSQPFAPGTLLSAGIRILGYPLPRATTPWISVPGGYTASCSSEAGADVLRITPARWRAGAESVAGPDLGPPPRRRQHRARQPPAARALAGARVDAGGSDGRVAACHARGRRARVSSDAPMTNVPRLDYVRDQHIERVVPLATPALLLHELPLSTAQAEVVIRGRRDVTAILDRSDDRLLVVVGPCSVHDPAAALDYARRLRTVAAQHEQDLCIAMRVYFEKPRTTVGWKGLINDPHLDGSGDVNAGLRLARTLLLEVLELGLPVGCEFLDPIIPQFIADTVAWGAIGARTTESQTHRQLASGLSMPVGFKNRTDGDLGVAVDAVRAAAAPHSFAGIDVAGTPAILHTTGNADCHVILRGGRGAPNYDAASVAEALAKLRGAGLPERVIVDASHDNSHKDHERQPLVAADIAAQVAAGDEALVGTMLESFLVAGRQDPDAGDGPLVYGQSVTDACMDWDTTVSVLDGFAAAVRARRAIARAA